MARNWVSITAHIFFGLIATWSYRWLADRPRPA